MTLVTLIALFTLWSVPHQTHFSEFLSHQAPIGILQLGLDGGITHANPAFCRLTGYTEAQLRHLDNCAISHPEDFVAELRVIQQLLDHGQRQQVLQKRYRRYDEVVIWAEVKLVLVEGSEGEASILNFVTDITDRRLIEQELQQCQEREALLADLAMQLRTTFDLCTVMQATVERLRQTLAVDRVLVYQCSLDRSSTCLVEAVASPYGTIQGQSFLPEGLFTPLLEADRNDRLWAVSDILDADLTDCYKSMLTNISIRSLMATAIVSMDAALKPQKRALWGLLVVHSHKSRTWTAVEQQLLRLIAIQLGTAIEQTQLLESLQQRAHPLDDRVSDDRGSVDYFRSFLEASMDVFVAYDSNLRCLFINPAGSKILELAPEAIVGKTNRELFGEAAEHLDATIQQTFNTGEKIFVAHELFLSQGSKIFETVYTPITTPSGIVQRVIGASRDVTELKQQWQLLETQNQQLAENIRVKQEFIATTSHELRTPLTAVLGFSNVLLQGFFGELNPKQTDYVERIHDSGQHLLDLINDILDLSRLEADRLELDLQAIFVPDVCEGVLGLIQERALNQGLKLAVDLDPSVDWIVADPRRLKQMLLNLLANAVKFTEEGTVGLKVYRQPLPRCVTVPPEAELIEPPPLCNSRLSEMIRFLVWDTGIGIDSDHQQRLFSPFSQIDSSLARNHQGTGLGLVITRKLAELHGGTVTLESSPNQGARFTVALPFHPTV